MKTVTIQKTERQYYIDWLRIILIISVFLFHIGMIFNTWGWHIKNDQQYGGMLRSVMIFLHNWRMPLLFLLSGAGTYFALGKRTPGQYLSERFKRLFIPLVAGIFILVPVQVYIEKASVYDSLLDFYPHMFEGIYPEGNFSWHHLWFIAYLFVIALFISPFLGLLRSEKFAGFTSRLEGIVTKPLALNIFILPLLLSQIVLRNYFEFGTNALVNDWASMAFYIIFFLAGFILLPNKNIAEAIRKQRLLYLAETIILTVIMFRVPGLFESERTSEIIWDVTALFMAWTCGITAVGIAKQYLNFDSDFRKIANEAIFPFYLLHQPVIVLVGYFVIRCDLEVPWKVLLITIISFSIIAGLYWLVIRRVNFLRVIFGMKMVRNEKNETVSCPVLIPVLADTTRPFSELR
jgi:peptidoglycan/LPS O-acetylase OafA/YrhL